MVPGRSDFYLFMFNFSRRELTHLPAVSAKIYSDLQIPIPEPTTGAGELQCSDWLSLTPLPILKARRGPPPNLVELRDGRVPKENQELLPKEEEGVWSRHTRLARCPAPLSI